MFIKQESYPFGTLYNYSKVKYGSAYVLSFQAVRELYHSGDCDIPVSAIISATGMFQCA